MVAHPVVSDTCISMCKIGCLSPFILIYDRLKPDIVISVPENGQVSPVPLESSVRL